MTWEVAGLPAQVSGNAAAGTWAARTIFTAAQAHALDSDRPPSKNGVPRAPPTRRPPRNGRTGPPGRRPRFRPCPVGGAAAEARPGAPRSPCLPGAVGGDRLRPHKRDDGLHAEWKPPARTGLEREAAPHVRRSRDAWAVLPVRDRRPRRGRSRRSRGGCRPPEPGSRARIRHVTGGIAGDESWFDTRRTVAGWKPSFFVNESPPLSALVVDRDRFGGYLSRTPALATTAAFARILRAAGVTISGSVQLGVASEYAFPLGDVESPALWTILRFMDRESDNFTAELLLKQLGAIKQHHGTSA